MVWAPGSRETPQPSVISGAAGKEVCLHPFAPGALHGLPGGDDIQQAFTLESRGEISTLSGRDQLGAHRA